MRLKFFYPYTESRIKFGDVLVCEQEFLLEILELGQGIVVFVIQRDL